MKKIPIFLFSTWTVFLLLACNNLFAQSFPRQIWEKTYTHKKAQKAHDLIQTSDGNFVMAGAMAGHADEYDLWLAKVNKEGSLLWEKRHGKKGEEAANAILETKDGGLVVVGYQANFWLETTQLWLIKTDASGNLLWEKNYQMGVTDNRGMDIIATSDGGFAITGATTPNGKLLADVWLIKTDESGNLQWQQNFDGGSRDEGYALVETTNGDFVIGGLTTSPVSGMDAVCLIRANARGEHIWNKNFHAFQSSAAMDLVATPDRGFALVGWAHNTQKYFDVLLLKTDVNGELQWQKNYGGIGGESAYSLLAHPNGNFTVGAFTSSKGSGEKDIWLLEFGKNGQLLSEKVYGSPLADEAKALCFTKQGGFAVAGFQNQKYFLGEKSDAWMAVFEGKPQNQNSPFKNSYAESKVKPNTQPVANKPSNTVRKPSTSTSTKRIPSIQIFWQQPDPIDFHNSLMNTDKERLDIRLKAISNIILQSSDFQIFVNGKKYTDAKFDEVRLVPRKNQYTYQNNLFLDAGENRIEVKVIKDGLSVGSEVLKVYYSAEKPNLHIISIGTNPINLQFTQKDAQDFAEAFKNQEGKLYAKVQTTSLLGKNATKTNIEGLLEAYRHTHTVGERDVLLLFMSSHGYVYQGDFYLQADNYDPIRKKTTSIAYDDLAESLKAIPGKKIVFIDACHSGGAKAQISAINQAIHQHRLTKAGLSVITSSQEDQTSYEDTAWQNGAFTEGILQALSGKADSNRNKILTIEELYQYLQKTVPEMVKQRKNQQQMPFMTSSELGDLPIYVID